MAPRANWKGYLKLALVSCPVALFPATTTRDRVRFNIINRDTGHRVRYDVVDAETGEEVPQENRLKGYKVGGDGYVLLEEQELDEVALESTHTIEVESFVERETVDELYPDEPYYLVPDDKVGHEAFAVIREAMREERLVGIARVVLFRRERLLMLWPRGKGIVGTTLRYKNEVRDERNYFDDIPDVKIAKDMLDLAKHILRSKKTEFDPSKFEDRYERALRKLIAAKQAGKPPPAPLAPQPTNVVSLMDALRRSVQAERRGVSSERGRSKARKRTAPKSAALKRAPARRKKLKRAS
ncbi:MAG TPA: Ku protein [Xanthobacteraceae bacterium]